MHFGLEQHCCCLIGGQIFENLASLEDSSKDGIYAHICTKFGDTYGLLSSSSLGPNIGRIWIDCAVVSSATLSIYPHNNSTMPTNRSITPRPRVGYHKVQAPPHPIIPKNANSHHPARPGTHPAKPIITHTYATPHTTHSLPLNTLLKVVVTATKPVPPAISAVVIRRPVKVGTKAKSRSGRTRRKGRSFVSWLEVVVGGGGREGEIRSSRWIKNSASTSQTGWFSPIQAL